MKTTSIQTSIENQAKEAWQLLMDYDFYPNWNPSIKKIEPIPGNEDAFVVCTQLPDFPLQYFILEEGKINRFKEFEWTFHFPFSDVILFNYSVKIRDISIKKCLVKFTISADEELANTFGNQFLKSLHEMLIQQGEYLKIMLEGKEITC